jgi:hypothetical protein
MTTLSLALLADGASDRALLPILTWALNDLSPETRFFEPEFEVRRGELAAEIERVSSRLQPDILFVHRDAEREPLELRLRTCREGAESQGSAQEGATRCVRA